MDAILSMPFADPRAVEYDTVVHALLHERLAASARPGLVVHLKDFSGYENSSALREDLKMDIAHRNDFSRIAVVGNRAWVKWGTKLAGFLTAAEMKWFDAAEADRAAEWARGDN